MGISNDDMFDIDEFLGVMGEYECNQAQGLKNAQNVSEATEKEVEVTGIPDKNFFDTDELLDDMNQKATEKEVEVTGIPDKNFFDTDELLDDMNQKGQYDAWFDFRY
nr:hypothetical protein [Tanacetum cinerariifolium]